MIVDGLGNELMRGYVRPTPLCQPCVHGSAGAQLQESVDDCEPTEASTPFPGDKDVVSLDLCEEQHGQHVLRPLRLAHAEIRKSRSQRCDILITHRLAMFTLLS